ncbi:hypothetical protein LCGC14_2731380 [marine sediment metagenome]|uniref:Uncharacterized protein n=1 Tax=marine sediment metagenome TaxID=412755 RepID=A0A0F8ZUF8_9ZZZZ
MVMVDPLIVIVGSRGYSRGNPTRRCLNAALLTFGDTFLALHFFLASSSFSRTSCRGHPAVIHQPPSSRPSLPSPWRPWWLSRTGQMQPRSNAASLPGLGAFGSQGIALLKRRYWAVGGVGFQLNTEPFAAAAQAPPNEGPVVTGIRS